MIRCGFSSSEGPAELNSHDRASALAALSRSCSAIPAKYLLRRLRDMRSDLTSRDVASAIEHSIAVWSEGRSKPYRRKLYSVLWAIRNDKKLFVKHDPWDVAWIKEDSLIENGSTRAKARAEESTIAISRKLHATITSIEADIKQQLQQFSLRRCPRCNSSDFERIAIQIRSADEGMTQLLQCTACNHRFR